jgi:uncharacterized coiled-coil protein SlyX
LPFSVAINDVAVLVAGLLLGRLDRWARARSSTDTQQATALALLTQSITHLNTTIGRLDVSLDRLWDRCSNLETRVSTLEGRQEGKA